MGVELNFVAGLKKVGVFLEKYFQNCSTPYPKTKIPESKKTLTNCNRALATAGERGNITTEHVCGDAIPNFADSDAVRVITLTF